MNGLTSRKEEVSKQTEKTVTTLKDSVSSYENNTIRASFGENKLDTDQGRVRISSILKNKTNATVESDNAIRRDSYGSQIKSGSKKHHIRFNPQLFQIKEVESYKEYNLDNPDTCQLCQIF